MKTKFKKLLMILPLAISAISISSCGTTVTDEEDTKPPVNGGVIPTYTVSFTVNGQKYDVVVHDKQQIPGTDLGNGLFLPEGVPLPVQEGDVYHDYVFSGWSGDFTNITEDMEITPEFTEKDKYYQVTYYDANNEILRQYQVKAGDSSIYDGPTPVKQGTATTDFVFTGWDITSDLAHVTKDLEAHPTFDETAKLFTVNFLVDGKIWDSKKVPSGEVIGEYTGPKPYRNPDISADGNTQTEYVFSGWDVDLNTTIVSSNMSVNAKFTAVYDQPSDKGDVSDDIEDSSTDEVTHNGITYKLIQLDLTEKGGFYLGYSRDADMFLLYFAHNAMVIPSVDGTQNLQAVVKSYIPFKFRKLSEATGDATFDFGNDRGNIKVTYKPNYRDSNILEPTGMQTVASQGLENLSSTVKDILATQIVPEYNVKLRIYLAEQGYDDTFTIF